MSQRALVDSPSADAHARSLTDPAAYRSLREVHQRYGDLGPDGRVSTVALARWFEDARVGADLAGFRRLVEDGGAGSFRVLLAAQRLERLEALEPDASYRLGLGVRRIGRTSFTYAYAVFAGERCVALGDSVTVLATADGPTELPADLREGLAAMVLDEPGCARSEPPPEWRRTRASYGFTVETRARAGDIDTNRHVNNVALASWYVDAVAALQLDLLGRPVGGPPPELWPSFLDVAYVAEVRYPAVYDVGVGVIGVDDGVARYACGLFRGPECVGLAELAGAVDESVAGGLERHRLPR